MTSTQSLPRTPWLIWTKPVHTGFWSGHRVQEPNRRTQTTRKKTTDRGESTHIIGKISLFHKLSLRTNKVVFVPWSDKGVLSVNSSTDTLSIRMRCRGSQFYTDGGFGRDNAGLCDSKVGLEGCSSWVARLGPHPHDPLKLGAGLSCSAGVLLERAHPCVIVQSFTYTSPCQKALQISKLAQFTCHGRR